MAKEQRWSVCPVEDCEYAAEFDPDAPAYCPDCGMELVSQCPGCKQPIFKEDQVNCHSCGLSFKE